MKRKIEISRILLHYGRTSQLFKTLEELDELKNEIYKELILSVDNKNEILTEIADVTIMCEQLKLMYSISDDDFEREVERKIQRQISRIKEGEK